MIYEDPDELGFTFERDLHGYFCSDHDVAYEECGGCNGEGAWHDLDLGEQPCTRCWGAGIVEHTCPAREQDDEGVDQ